jgi:transposase-like protein
MAGIVGAKQYTPEQRAAAVERVFENMPEGMTVKDTARRLKIKPGTLRMWIAKNPEWTEQYEALKPHLGDALVDEAMELSKNSTSSTTAMDRVRIDLLKWVASKVAPKSFGDRQVVEHQGTTELKFKVVEEGGGRVATISATAVVAEPTPEKISGPAADAEG